VVWRKAPAANPLTIGAFTFVNDDRISVGHRPGSNEWNLLIKSVQVKHDGTYECQVSTKERDIRQPVYLHVRGKGQGRGQISVFQLYKVTGSTKLYT
jgi:hypothetical protein